jgi:hypothetical protein
MWLDFDWLGEHQACIFRAKSDPIWLRLPGTGLDGGWSKEDEELPTRLYRLDPLGRHLGSGDGRPAVR